MPSLQGVAGHPRGTDLHLWGNPMLPSPHRHPRSGPPCNPGHLGNRFPKHRHHQVTPKMNKTTAVQARSGACPAVLPPHTHAHARWDAQRDSWERRPAQTRRRLCLREGSRARTSCIAPGPAAAFTVQPASETRTPVKSASAWICSVNERRLPVS